MIDVRSTEVAVRRAFIVEKREGRKKSPAGLGFAQINYGRLFVRDYWTLFAIARELDCSVSDLVEDSPQTRSGPRWSELIQASEEILDQVRTLPPTPRSLVTLRGEGFSWRRIQLQFPGRAMFSLKEDHGRSLASVGRASADALNFLASLDNYFVVSHAA